MTNNELFMIDIYNELGKDYKTTDENLKNLQDLYLKIYFPRIKQNEIKTIINYLNNNTKEEHEKIENVYKELNNDLMELYEIGLIEVSYDDNLDPMFSISPEGLKFMEEKGFSIEEDKND
jgi:hypothetical protein